MIKKLLKALWILSLSVVIVSTAFAQRQTGTLAGKSVDPEGEKLPEVKITLSSLALMGSRDFVTTGEGNFRFPALSPGTYSITCVLPGFKKVIRTGIIISVGKTTNITIILEQSVLEEEVTVTAAAPIVDTTASKIGYTISKALIENLPSKRDMGTVLLSTPGMVKDSLATVIPFMSTHGGETAGNIIALDGLTMEDPSMRQMMTDVDLNMIEEIEMEYGAHPAEVGSASGSYVNIVTSSGGNKFHGRGEFYFFDKIFVDKNITKEHLDSLGIASPATDKSRFDLSPSLGGPILKDKLWFFIAGRYLKRTARLIGFPEDYTDTQSYAMGKLSFRVKENIKLVGYYNYRIMDVPYSVSLAADMSRITVEAARHNRFKWHNVNATLNWILSPNAFMDVKGMYISRWYTDEKQSGATHYNYDKGTGWTSGAYSSFAEYEQWRYVALTSTTLFLDGFLGGNHEIKLGAGYEKAGAGTDRFNPEPIQTYTDNGSPYYYGENKGRFIAQGLPPTTGISRAISRLWSLNFYVQDSWTIRDRLTLNIGVRFDSQHAYLPAQIAPEVTYWTWLNPDFFSEKEYPKVDDLIVWNKFSPRIGLVFDIFGTKKTIFKASFSRYNDYLKIRYWGGMNQNSGGNITYYWTDNNWDGQINAADTFSLVSSSGRQDRPPKEMLDPDTKVPFWNEYIVGIDHELAANFKASMNLIHKNNSNVFGREERNNRENWSVPLQTTDPGYDGVFGTSDDAQLKIWDRSKPFSELYYTNPEGHFRKYLGLELILEKRMSNNWQFIGSAIWSKNWGTIGNEYLAGAGRDPNYLINREGRLDTDRPLIVKLQGTYILPYGIYFSAHFLSYSGTPFGRTLRVWAPNALSYVNINAEPPGTRRRPSWNNLDLRIEKEFVIGDFGKLGVYVDVENATNTFYTTIQDTSHGYIEKDGSFREDARWLDIIRASNPRLIYLGLRFTF